MDYIDRYVYAVGKRFSGKQRQEIEQELRSNIEDMVEGMDEKEPYAQRVEATLMQLGKPENIAQEYQGGKRYLIGPSYYETYLMILKIVVAAVLGGISVAMLVRAIFVTDKSLLPLFSDYLSALFAGALQAFAWITLVFVTLERSGQTKLLTDANHEPWSLEDLPAIPKKQARISRTESVVGIILSTLFYTFIIVMIYSAPHLLGLIYSQNGELVVIPMFQVFVLQGLMPFWITIFILSLLKEMANLFFGRWTIKLSLITIVLTLISTVLAVMIFANPEIWHLDFAQQVMAQMNLEFDFISFWEQIKRWIVPIIVLAGALEIIEALFKGIRYGYKKDA